MQTAKVEASTHVGASTRLTTMYCAFIKANGDAVGHIQQVKDTKAGTGMTGSKQAEPCAGPTT